MTSHFVLITITFAECIYAPILKDTRMKKIRLAESSTSTAGKIVEGNQLYRKKTNYIEYFGQLIIVCQRQLPVMHCGFFDSI